MHEPSAGEVTGFVPCCQKDCGVHGDSIRKLPVVWLLCVVLLKVLKKPVAFSVTCAWRNCAPCKGALRQSRVVFTQELLWLDSSLFPVCQYRELWFQPFGSSTAPSVGTCVVSGELDSRHIRVQSV